MDALLEAAQRDGARAQVHLDRVPPELLEELPELYSSAFCTAEYFAVHDRPLRMGACELNDPRHVIVFTASGATVDVLNKVIDVGPDAVQRYADAIFRARPGTRRIRAELKYAPRLLDLPARETYRGDDQVVELPASVPEWEASLGKSSRRNLRGYRNRLYRRHPDFELRALEGAEVSLALVEEAFAWNRERIGAKGERWGYEGHPEAPYRTWQLMQRHGVALCGFDGDRHVATELLLFVGRDCWAHSGAVEPAYLEVRLGSLMTSFVIEESIRRGCARTHLMWGTIPYKHSLGARPVTGYRVSLYRSRFDKALYARDRWAALVRDRELLYWRARGELKRRLPAVARLKERMSPARRRAAGSA
jgi:hypothetical protein